MFWSHAQSGVSHYSTELPSRGAADPALRPEFQIWPHVAQSAKSTLQPSKASFPMCVTEFGMVKLAKELQCLKAQSPMCVTESGMVKLAKERQS